MMKVGSKVITISFICSFAILFLLYQNVYFLKVKHVDIYSFVTESVITLTIFLIILNFQMTKKNKTSFNYINLGFTFLFVALFTDTCDELYQVSKNVTRFFEDTLQVVGFAFLLVGIRIWRKETKRQTKRLNLLAATDDLTGLYLRRHFQATLKDAFFKAKDTNIPFAILMIDIDNFKIINDQFGHMTGDKVLKEFAQQLRHCVDENEALSRWGGEEFIVMSDAANHHKALIMAESIRHMAQSLSISEQGQILDISVSIGVSHYCEADVSVDSLINRADKLLYMAKNAGRNCIRSDADKSEIL